MFMKIRKLQSIRDIDELPSVLDIEEVSLYLIQLVDILNKFNTDPITGAEEINNLISYQGYNEEGLSLDASHKILEYIKNTYKPEHKDSVEWNTANLANLTCMEAKEFMETRLKLSSSLKEQKELRGALSEITIKT